MKKEMIIGFFIGIGIYMFTIGIRVLKVLIRAKWNFSMIQHGLYTTFNDPVFVINQVLILILCVAGSITVYYYYKKGYFFQK